MRRLALLASVSLLAACATTTPSVSDIASVPGAYDHASTTEGAAVAPDWWRTFGDPALDALIEEALAANQDIAQGMARVRQARAAVASARSTLLPQLSGGASASSNSDDGFGDFSTSARASASWQLDLFGENRAGLRAAREGWRGQTFAQRGLELTVQSDVAANYFSLNALRGRLDAARANLEISERIYSIVRARYEAGDVSGFDMASQEAAIANARARIPQLEQQIVSVETALAVLLGRAPQGYGAPQTDILSLLPPSVDPGLPSDLLHRRPDLLAAESALAAADANVDAARAAFLPSVDLSSGVVAAGLTGGTSVVGSFAASVAQTIFSGGRLEANLESSRARLDERIAAYRQAALNALRDVDVSLSALRTAELREVQLESARDAAARSLDLAETRYRTGADNLTSLLNAQATYFSASDSLVQGRLDRLNAATDLFVALGGGWAAESL